MVKLKKLLVAGFDLIVPVPSKVNVPAAGVNAPPSSSQAPPTVCKSLVPSHIIVP